MQSQPAYGKLKTTYGHGDCVESIFGVQTQVACELILITGRKDSRFGA